MLHFSPQVKGNNCDFCSIEKTDVKIVDNRGPQFMSNWEFITCGKSWYCWKIPENNDLIYPSRPAFSPFFGSPHWIHFCNGGSRGGLFLRDFQKSTNTFARKCSALWKNFLSYHLTPFNEEECMNYFARNSRTVIAFREFNIVCTFIP